MSQGKLPRPRLEVAICTHNRASELDLCLQVLGRQQAPPGWQVTVIDNNSNDATADVVARHAAAGAVPSLRRIFESVPGLTAARQRAMRDSHAEWVTFVDDDCHLRPGWISAALATIEMHPGIGALGGRVLPDYGRPTSGHLGRNGWLFAHQDHGDAACTVDHLVGAGLVLNRAALARTGWTNRPLLADRIGRSSISGGDVEISLRLRAAGYALRYDPVMIVDHKIARDRQNMATLLDLAAGLGRGATLASLLTAADFALWLQGEQADMRVAGRRHRKALLWVLSRRYPVRDWRIFDAFLSGRRRQLFTVAGDPNSYRVLAGTCLLPATAFEEPH